MKNFLEETKEFLQKHNKTLDDIVFIRTDEVNVKDKNKFFKFMDFDYDNGFGRHCIPLDLRLVGKDFWLERSEYDGSEWWVFKSYPLPAHATIDLVLNSNGRYFVLENR